MPLLSLRLVLVCGGLICSAAHAAAGDAVPAIRLQDCSVQYQDDEGSFADRLTVAVTETAPATLPSGSVEHQPSPFDTGTLTAYKFDASNEGKGTIVFALQPRVGPQRFISFAPATAGEAKWLNEDLVFIRIWWGRVIASEMVFDTRGARFVYRRIADYGYSDRPDCRQFEK